MAEAWRHAWSQRLAPASIPRHACVYAEHTFTYDALSIKRQSFWLDLKLIGLSFWITCRGTWEHRGKKF